MSAAAPPVGSQIRAIREREGANIAIQLLDLHVTTTLLIGHVYHRSRSEALADIFLLAQRLEAIRNLIAEDHAQ